jgi:hypothetical protein
MALLDGAELLADLRTDANQAGAERGQLWG